MSSELDIQSMSCTSSLWAENAACCVARYLILASDPSNERNYAKNVCAPHKNLPQPHPLALFSVQRIWGIVLKFSLKAFFSHNSIISSIQVLTGQFPFLQVNYWYRSKCWPVQFINLLASPGYGEAIPLVYAPVRLCMSQLHLLGLNCFYERGISLIISLGPSS